MSILLAIPVVFILLLLQTTLAREVNILNGSVDLLLTWLCAWGVCSKDNSIWVWVGIGIAAIAFVSAIPFYVYLAAYLSIIVLTKIISKRFWQSPLMSMFVITIVSSLILYLFSFLVLQSSSSNLNWNTSLVQIIIPSILMNLFLAFPIYAIVKDTTGWVFHAEVES